MRDRRQQGSLVLVALCCVAVIGIAVASFLAVSAQATKLSNRSFQTGVSEQLAEIGLEEALRAFNTNDWATWSSAGTTATWSISGATASCTITFPATKYGSSGVTGSVKVRVDNYNVYHLPSSWNSTAIYRVGDLVGSNGIWYRCVQNHTNQAPGDLAYWVQAPIAWAWGSKTPYALYEVVNQNGVWYRCSTPHTSSTTFAADSGKWTSIPALSLSWNSAATYAVDSFVYHSGTGTWYRCTTTHANSTPPSSNWSTGVPYISWQWIDGATYRFDDVVYYNDNWYRCITAHTANSSLRPPTTTWVWENALSGSASSPRWSSGSITYNLGDAVYYSGTLKWYRCIRSHSSSASLTPTNATYWADTPLFSTTWDSNRSYGVNDTVFYNGIWYRCLLSNNGLNPAYNAASWAGTTSATYQWTSATTYSAGSYASYGGVWYKCILAPTARQTPNNSTYWTASWPNTAGITTGAPVIYAEGIATLPDGTAPIKTQVRATVSVAPLFPNAIAATSTVTLVGTAAGTVDSYDASSGSWNQTSTPFSAGTPNLSYAAVIAGGNPTATAVSVSNTTVKGYVAAPSAATSPYDPRWTQGSGVTVTGSATTGVDMTRVSRSPNIPQFQTLPTPSLASAFSTGNFPKGTLLEQSFSASTTMRIGTPGATSPSIYYYDGRLNIGSGYQTNTLQIRGPVILYIYGDLRIRSGGMLEILSTGSAEIHCDYLRTYSGGHGIYNRTQDPQKLLVIADSTAITTTYLDNGVSGTNRDFYGVIYAPNTTAPLGLNIRTGIAIYGAISAKNITFSAETNFHYDTSLRAASFHGVDAPKSVSQWRELSDQTERAILP